MILTLVAKIKILYNHVFCAGQVKDGIFEPTHQIVKVNKSPVTGLMYALYSDIWNKGHVGQRKQFLRSEKLFDKRINGPQIKRLFLCRS